MTSGDNRTARVWDVATGRELVPPLRHANGVVQSAFSPDADRVLTASFVTREIERIDVAELLTWGAERLTRRDLEAVTRALARGLTSDPPEEVIYGLVSHVQAFVAVQ